MFLEYFLLGKKLNLELVNFGANLTLAGDWLKERSMTAIKHWTIITLLS